MRGGGRGDSVWLTRTLRGNRNDASLGAAAPRWNSAACVLGVCASALLREGHLGCEPLVSSPTRPIGRAGSREKERKRINPPPPIPPLPQHSHKTHTPPPAPPTAHLTTHTPKFESSAALDVAGNLPSPSRSGRSSSRCLAPWSPEAKVALIVFPVSRRSVESDPQRSHVLAARVGSESSSPRTPSAGPAANLVGRLSRGAYSARRLVAAIVVDEKRRFGAPSRPLSAGRGPWS